MTYLVLVCIIGILFLIDIFTKKHAISNKKVVYNKGAFIGFLKNKPRLLSLV